MKIAKKRIKITIAYTLKKNETMKTTYNKPLIKVAGTLTERFLLDVPISGETTPGESDAKKFQYNDLWDEIFNDDNGLFDDRCDDIWHG